MSFATRNVSEGGPRGNMGDTRVVRLGFSCAGASLQNHAESLGIDPESVGGTGRQLRAISRSSIK